MSTKKLSEILGEIYNKVHHLYPQKTGAKVMDWVNTEDTTSITEDEYNTANVIQPAYYTPEFEFSDPWQWDEQWGATTWGAVPQPLVGTPTIAGAIYWGVSSTGVPQGIWHENTLVGSAMLWGQHVVWGSAPWAAHGVKNWSL